MMFALRKKKYWMPTLVTCLIVLLLVSYTLASEMTLERDTLHYICSSIVQGFAAFVGILFVALVFMQQRGKELIKDALEEAIESASRLVGIIEGFWSKATMQTGVVYDALTKLKNFHEKRIAPPVDALKSQLDDLDAGRPLRYSVKDANDLVAGHLETIKNYRRAGALVGRYICECKAMRKFTMDILTVALTMRLANNTVMSYLPGIRHWQRFRQEKAAEKIRQSRYRC